MLRNLERGEGVTLAVVICIMLILFLFPLGLLGQVAFRDGFAPFLAALETRSVPRALWNSLESAALSALLALAAGTTVAVILGLTDIRGKASSRFSS